MTILIIAGGSGTRLWPLSTPKIPKHLLKLGQNRRSLLQQTYDRAKNISNNIYVISEKSHIELIKKQLPDLSENNLIVEPDRRGTANCIIASLSLLTNLIDNNEPIAFIHSDHLINDLSSFTETFKKAEEISRKYKRLVLVGVEPTYPATGFGYIKKGPIIKNTKNIYSVKSFKEKPDNKKALNYYDSGNYLWNCGYFVASINTFRELIIKYAPTLFITYQNLIKSLKSSQFERIYMNLESDSIDYALIEKAKNLLVVTASFDWKDLGTYNDLFGVLEHDDNGNYINGKVEILNVHNCYIDNQDTKTLAVIGLDNCTIVNNENGTLVALNKLSQEVGVIAKKIV